MCLSLTHASVTEITSKAAREERREKREGGRLTDLQEREETNADYFSAVLFVTGM